MIHASIPDKAKNGAYYVDDKNRKTYKLNDEVVHGSYKDDRYAIALYKVTSYGQTYKNYKNEVARRAYLEKVDILKEFGVAGKSKCELPECLLKYKRFLKKR
jgi:hypothetical protein